MGSPHRPNTSAPVLGRGGFAQSPPTSDSCTCQLVRCQNDVNMRGRNAINDKAVSRNLLVQTSFGILPSTRSCRRWCRSQAFVESLAKICIRPSRNIVAAYNIGCHAWTFRVRALACSINKTPLRGVDNACRHPPHRHSPVGHCHSTDTK